MTGSKVRDHRGEANEGKPFESTRVTVNLVAKANTALKVEQRHSGDKQTDIINRAIQVYGYLMAALREEGAQLQIKNGDEVQKLVLF